MSRPRFHQVVPEIVNIVRVAGIVMDNGTFRKLRGDFLQISRVVGRARTINQSERSLIRMQAPGHRKDWRDPDTAGDK